MTWSPITSQDLDRDRRSTSPCRRRSAGCRRFERDGVLHLRVHNEATTVALFTGIITRPRQPAGAAHVDGPRFCRSRCSESPVATSHRTRRVISPVVQPPDLDRPCLRRLSEAQRRPRVPGHHADQRRLRARQSCARPGHGGSDAEDVVDQHEAGLGVGPGRLRRQPDRPPVSRQQLLQRRRAPTVSASGNRQASRRSAAARGNTSARPTTRR